MIREIIDYSKHVIAKLKAVILVLRMKKFVVVAVYPGSSGDNYTEEYQAISYASEFITEEQQTNIMQDAVGYDALNSALKRIDTEFTESQEEIKQLLKDAKTLLDADGIR